MTTHALPTNDPSLRSWIETANDGVSDFPIQNLPLGMIARKGADESPRVGVAIGDRALDLAECWSAGLFAGTPVESDRARAKSKTGASRPTFDTRGRSAGASARRTSSPA